MIGLLEWHVTKFVENLQEVIVVNYIIEACGEKVHELHEFTRLDASHVFENHVDEVCLLNDACVVWIVHSKLGVKVNLHMVIHLIDLLQNCCSLQVLENYFFF